MSPLEIFAVGGVLVVALLLGRLLARSARVPDAAAYVLIGVAAGVLPWLPHVRLSPEMVLLVLLPPLVWYAAFFSDPRETVAHIGPIVGQSVGLVLATAGVAACCLMAVFPQVGWAAAVAFGAAIAPPDPVAATNVLDRLGVPSRLTTVLEGEGLVNDGAALTLFGIALMSIENTPSPRELAIRIVLEIGGGVLFGLVVGIVVTWIRGRIRDVPSQVVLSLATPYLAFVPTQLAHASGVLATVVAAVWQGTRGRGLVAPTARLHTETFWRVLNTLLVAALFLLLGMQVPTIVAAVRSYPTGALVAVALALLVGVIAVRMGWALLVAPALARLHLGGSTTARMPRSERLALGWCGPRGAVSLAVALSLPLTLPGGAPFSWQPLLLFLTMVVVLATLVGQVVTLPPLLRWLKLSPSRHERLESLHARRAASDAALGQLDHAEEQGFDREQVEALRQNYELRRDRLTEELDHEPSEHQRPRLGERELQLRMVHAQREALRKLRSRREISGRTLVQLSQELDLDETRLRGPGE
jgi:CPA1 family monovalent cation:H+ antiporter